MKTAKYTLKEENGWLVIRDPHGGIVEEMKGKREAKERLRKLNSGCKD